MWAKQIISTPWNWNAVRIALLHESVSCIVQKTTGNSRKEQCRQYTLRSRLHTHRRSAAARIVRQPRPGHTRHSRKVQRMEAPVEHACKLVQEHFKSENMCAVEACGAKWRHICVHELHEISDRDAASTSPSLGVFCAETTQDRVKGLSDSEV